MRNLYRSIFVKKKQKKKDKDLESELRGQKIKGVKKALQEKNETEVE